MAAEAVAKEGATYARTIIAGYESSTTFSSVLKGVQLVRASAADRSVCFSYDASACTLQDGDEKVMSTGGFGMLFDELSTLAMMCFDERRRFGVSAQIQLSFYAPIPLGGVLEMETYSKHSGDDVAFLEGVIRVPGGPALAHASHVKYVGGMGAVKPAYTSSRDDETVGGLGVSPRALSEAECGGKESEMRNVAALRATLASDSISALLKRNLSAVEKLVRREAAGSSYCGGVLRDLTVTCVREKEKALSFQLSNESTMHNPLGSMHGGFVAVLLAKCSSLAYTAFTKAATADHQVISTSIEFLSHVPSGAEVEVVAKLSKAGKRLAFIDTSLGVVGSRFVLARGSQILFLGPGQSPRL